MAGHLQILVVVGHSKRRKTNLSLITSRVTFINSLTFKSMDCETCIFECARLHGVFSVPRVFVMTPCYLAFPVRYRTGHVAAAGRRTGYDSRADSGRRRLHTATPGEQNPQPGAHRQPGRVRRHRCRLVSAHQVNFPCLHFTSFTSFWCAHGWCLE